MNEFVTIKITKEVAKLIKSWGNANDFSYDCILRKKFGLDHVRSNTRNGKENENENSNRALAPR